MGDKYLGIQRGYLEEAMSRGAGDLAQALPARHDGDYFYFRAFGEECELGPGGITLRGEPLAGPEGILVALYARHVQDIPERLHPLVSFKELPSSGPYQGAFVMRAEQSLVPHVQVIKERLEPIVRRFSGRANPDAPSGDFSFTLYPLPRLPLYYMFYLPDDEFPAGVTCLFGADARDHLPVDGLADVAEYTAKRIIALVKGGRICAFGSGAGKIDKL